MADDTGSSDSDNITGDGKLTVTGVAPGDTVEYIVTEPGSATALAAKTPAQYNTYIDATGRADGLYSVVVKVTDVAGNNSSTSKAFTLDKTLPTTPTPALAVDTGGSDIDGVTHDDTVEVSGLDTGAT